MAFGMGAAFNEPPTDDPTSAPAEPMPSPGQQISQMLAKQKKRQKGARTPEALAAAISKAKRGRQTGQKWG